MEYFLCFQIDQPKEKKKSKKRNSTLLMKELKQNPYHQEKNEISLSGHQKIKVAAPL